MADKLPASFGFEHRNPLPVGRYWYFAIDSKKHPTNTKDFDAWLAKHRAAGALRVAASELVDEGGIFLDLHPRTTFTVFEVLRPNVVVWEGPGLPDRSPPHVTSHQDVEKAPVILEPAERISEAADAFGKRLTRGGESIALLLFAAGVLYLLSTTKRGSDDYVHD